jgi:predicted Fe-Mo cluster-binding NifX family protein
MKVCVTSQGDNLDSAVDPRFGRSQYFMIVDTDSLEFEAITNPNVSGMGGVGIQSAQIMSDKKVEAILTGNVGPNAFQILKAANITVITGISGSVKEAVEKYKGNQFKSTDGPSVDSKFGVS